MDDDMCPNCLTPWKCNGPHIPQVQTVTTEEGAEIAAQYLERAARELRAGDYSHVDVWIDSARPWLPASTH